MKTASVLPRVAPALVRFVRWHRRAFAAGLAFLAVLVGFSSLQPPRTPTVTVIAAARDLPGGSTLTAADLVRLELPLDAAPAQATGDVGQLVGAVINAPLTARSVLTRATVAGGQALAAPGLVVIAVPLTNPALAPLVKAGSRVDVIGSGSVGIVARDVRVVSFSAESPGGLMAQAQRFLLVEVTPDIAAKVASASSGGGVTVALR